MLVADIMNENVRVVAPGATAREVAEAMSRTGVGTIVVVDDGAPRGIVTDRDLAIRVLARGLGPDVEVSTVMTTEPVTVSPTDDLGEALRVMRTHSVRRTPVVDESGLVGILSICDIVVNAAELDEVDLTLADLCERETEPRSAADEHRDLEKRHP